MSFWCVFEDPSRDAIMATPVWRREINDEVLPVVSGTDPLDALQANLDLKHLRCRVEIVDCDEGLAHVVFSDGGRQLQLEMARKEGLDSGIVTAAIPPRGGIEKRNLALRRLNDLAETGVLREHLYPADTRAPRYARILQALDGALSGARHRDIAIGLFGQERVVQDWSLPDNHLRDHVRRAVAQGRALMTSGFTRLLT